MSIPQSGGGLIEHESQLAEYMESGSKTADLWRIGTEHEKFGWLTDTRLPLPYAGDRSISALFAGLEDRFGWTPVREGDNIIGMTRDGANISLEPGGQFELSGAAVETVHQTDAETRLHLDEVAEIAGPLGIRFMGIGAAPDWTHAQMPVMPKGRYRLMTDYMGRVGTHGTQMMYRTCTVQVNLDYASEADMVKKLRVALALQPVATALFASSPFFDGKLNGHKSWRSRIWRGLDDSRTGMLPFVFEEGMGFQRYVDWVLDVPMYFVYRDGKYIDAAGLSFRDFLAGRLSVLPGEKPKLGDWKDHLSTAFPEVRLKGYLEMRGADGGRWDRICALPAFWVGLLYDDIALDAAWELVKGWSHADHDRLRTEVPRLGLQAASPNGGTLQDLARTVLDIADKGLARRARLNKMGDTEQGFLNPLREIAESGLTNADRMLALYNGEWGGDVSRAYAAESY